MDSIFFFILNKRSNYVYTHRYALWSFYNIWIHFFFIHIHSPCYVTTLLPYPLFFQKKALLLCHKKKEALSLCQSFPTASYFISGIQSARSLFFFTHIQHVQAWKNHACSGSIFFFYFACLLSLNIFYNSFLPRKMSFWFLITLMWVTVRYNYKNYAMCKYVIACPYDYKVKKKIINNFFFLRN